MISYVFSSSIDSRDSFPWEPPIKQFVRRTIWKVKLTVLSCSKVGHYFLQNLHNHELVFMEQHVCWLQFYLWYWQPGIKKTKLVLHMDYDIDQVKPELADHPCIYSQFIPYTLVLKTSFLSVWHNLNENLRIAVNKRNFPLFFLILPIFPSSFHLYCLCCETAKERLYQGLLSWSPNRSQRTKTNY